VARNGLIIHVNGGKGGNAKCCCAFGAFTGGVYGPGAGGGVA